MEGAGGEVRRLQIIYFLSRMGHIEHPHLIRVHHLNRRGVHLRDVKRWLSELRGKEMPNSFAWSYKRRYRTGYVWQDLVDDDLITPVSDDEYVLKGSQISASLFDPCAFAQRAVSSPKKSPQESFHIEEKHHRPCSPEGRRRPVIEIQTRIMSSEIEEESPPFGSETQTSTGNSTKPGEEKHYETRKRDLHDLRERFKTSSSYHSIFFNKENMNSNDVEKTSASSAVPRRKSYSGGASHMFRNLITCGGLNTEDSAMVTINKAGKTAVDDSPEKRFNESEKLGGRQHDARRNSDYVGGSKKNKKLDSAAFNAVPWPTCSQCGKSFKPDKMHAHMKSCRGMKALAKSAATDREKATSTRSKNSSTKESAAVYFLTHP